MESVLAAIGMARILLWLAIWNPYGAHYVVTFIATLVHVTGLIIYLTIASLILRGSLL